MASLNASTLNITDTMIMPARNITAGGLLLSEILIFSGVFFIISAIGIIGNSLVIVAIAGDAKMRKSTMNALLLNLAAADLCNLIACAPEFALILLNEGWLLPAWLCPVLRLVERIFLYTSLLTQLAVGIERFIAIAYPMKVHLLCSRKKVTWWSALLWIIAMICASPYAWHKVVPRPPLGHPECYWYLQPKTKLALSSAECLLFYFLPLVLIVILYSCIAAKLWSRNQHLHEGRRPDSRPSETLKTRQNVVKMLIVCICLYFACYSPIQARFVSAVIFGKHVRFGLRGILALNCLVMVCSMANPIVYTLFSHRFRRKFVQLLCCFRKEYQRSHLTPATTSWTAVNQYNVIVNNNNCSPCRRGTKDSDIHTEDMATDCEMSSSLLLNNEKIKLPPLKCTRYSYQRNSSAASIQSTAFVDLRYANGKKKKVLFRHAVLRKTIN